MDLKIGETLNSVQHSYELLSPLGKGGFGVTWRARRADGREVVIKQLRLERVGDWKAVELFEREARVLQSLQHPRIPACTDFFHQAERCFLVLTLIPGQPLSALMREGRRLERAQMLSWFTTVLEVLVYLHARNPPVIHRDINPKNIMLEPSGAATLIDFGAVQAALSSGDSVASTSAGTFGYAPAEQFVGRATPQSDLYGLAMSFLAIQTGQEPERLPFAGGRIQVREALAGHDVDARISLVLEQMTDPDPARRPASAQEVLDRLRGVQPGATPTPATPAAPVVAGAIDWDAARARVLALGEDAWFASPPLPAGELERVEVSPDGSAVALICYEGVYLWHLPTQRVQALLRDEISSRRAGFSPDGRVLVITDTYNERIHVVQISADGQTQQRRISGAALKKLGEDDLFIAVSPDGQSALLGFEDTWNESDNVALVELGKGAMSARMKARCEHGLGFSPDGQALVCVGDVDEEHGGLRMFGADGGHKDHKYIAFAFSPDGRAAAWASEDDRGVTIGAVNATYPLDAKRLRVADLNSVLGITGEDERYEIQQLRWSADGARLAVAVNSLRKDAGSPHDTSWDIEIVVVDVASGRATHLILDPHSPDRRFDDLHSFAFSADGHQLIVCASCHIGGTAHLGAQLYALPEGAEARHIGAMQVLNHGASPRTNIFFNGQAVSSDSLAHASASDDEDSDVDDDEDSDADDDAWQQEEASPEEQAMLEQALAMFAGVKGDREDKMLPCFVLSSGFFGRLDRDAPIGSAQRAPYEDWELVRAVLRGSPQEAHLSATAREALADVALRKRIVEGLVWREALAVEGGKSVLVNATRGMTHLLPAMMEDARRRAEQRPRFGQGQGGAVKLSATLVAEAAADMARRSPDERAVLYEQSSAARAALDATLAVPPRVYPAGRQPRALATLKAKDKAVHAPASSGAMVASGAEGALSSADRTKMIVSVVVGVILTLLGGLILFILR
jgi:hypothetical protein